MYVFDAWISGPLRTNRYTETSTSASLVPDVYSNTGSSRLYLPKSITIESSNYALYKSLEGGIWRLKEPRSDKCNFSPSTNFPQPYLSTLPPLAAPCRMEPSLVAGPSNVEGCSCWRSAVTRGAQPGISRWTNFAGPSMSHYSSVLTTMMKKTYQLRTSYAKFKTAG